MSGSKGADIIATASIRLPTELEQQVVRTQAAVSGVDGEPVGTLQIHWAILEAVAKDTRGKAPDLQGNTSATSASTPLHSYFEAVVDETCFVLITLRLSSHWHSLL